MSPRFKSHSRHVYEVPTEYGIDRSELEVTKKPKNSHIYTNHIKTDTLQLLAKHRIAGRLYNISLMYDLVLWNRFLKKKKIELTRPRIEKRKSNIC